MENRRAERTADVNGVFREANERIRQAAEEYDHELDRIPFLCECPVKDCLEIVRLTQEEYSDVRAGTQRFVTAVGHEASLASSAEVIARGDGFSVVEKR